MTETNDSITLTMIMEAQHANVYGNVHGGEVMRIMDTTAGCTAIKYSKCNCVTARVDELQFLKPIHIGHLLTCVGTIVYTGNTSIEVRVTVDTEDIFGDSPKGRAMEAFFTLVALDEDGSPTRVPPFTPVTEREKELFDYVKARREFDRQRRSNPNK